MTAVEVVFAVPVRVAGLGPPGIVVEVRGRIPALRTDVGAAAERDGVVDDDRFLVMAGAQRQLAIERQLDLGADEGLAVLDGEPVLGGRDRQGRFPAQDAHVQVRPVRGQALQERPDPIGVRTAATLLGVEQGLGFESPVQQVHRVARPEHRLHGRVEIGLGVDDQRGLVSALAPPAVRSRLEQHLRLQVRPNSGQGQAWFRFAGGDLSVAFLRMRLTRNCAMR